MIYLKSISSRSFLISSAKTGTANKKGGIERPLGAERRSGGGDFTFDKKEPGVFGLHIPPGRGDSDLERAGCDPEQSVFSRLSAVRHKVTSRKRFRDEK